jgi:CRISPR-associated protein Cst1
MIKELEINWFIQPTGDPFTDVGGYVWEFLSKKHPNKKPIEIIEIVAKIYINDWEQKMHPFFANSKITHNSFGGKPDKSLTETRIFYRQILDEAPELVVSKKGFCRITGRETAVYSAERSTTILNGAGSLMNFHHAFENGSMVSKEVLVRNFVMPLGVVQVGGLPAIVISNDERITRFIVEENCQKHLDALGQNIKKGLRKAKASNPANALFDYILRILQDIKYEFDIEKPNIEGVSLNLFHFSNFVNGVALNLHTLSASAFNFYGYCLKRYSKEWLTFVNAHYKMGDDKKKDKKEVALEEDAPESHPNPILNKIMKGSNLTYEFLSWVVNGKQLNFKIIELYQILIRNMDKRTLQVLRRVAEFVANKCSDDDTTKAIKRLNSANSRQDVFIALLKLVEKNKDNEEALIRLEDVEFIFPEGFGWREMRNILLIAVYEQLHEANRKVGDVGELPDEKDPNAVSENNKD